MHEQVIKNKLDNKKNPACINRCMDGRSQPSKEYIRMESNDMHCSVLNCPKPTDVNCTYAC